MTICWSLRWCFLLFSLKVYLYIILNHLIKFMKHTIFLIFIIIFFLTWFCCRIIQAFNLLCLSQYATVSFTNKGLVDINASKSFGQKFYWFKNHMLPSFFHPWTGASKKTWATLLLTSSEYGFWLGVPQESNPGLLLLFVVINSF